MSSSKSFKKSKIIISVTLALILILSAVAFANRKNIMAVYFALTNSQANISQKLSDNQKNSDEILNSLTNTKMRDLTQDEVQKYNDGNLSENDALSLIKGENSNGGSTDDLIAKMYLLRAEYKAMIDSLLKEAKQEVKNIPKEQLTFSKKLDLVDKYISKGLALESQCDAKVESIISQLKEEISKNGGDTKIISKIRQMYEDEKQLKKSELINKYYPR